jgi:biopolymer transport protein ExbB
MKKQWLVIFIAAVAVVVLGQHLLAQTAEVAGAAAVPLKVESRQTLFDLIKSGGWAMWALGTCSVVMVWLIVFNFQRVSTRKMLPADIIGQIKSAADRQDYVQLWHLSSASDTFFTRILTAGLRQIRPDDLKGSREKMEAAIAETAGREESRYGFYVNFLALLTSMAPMWGLLGTVSGMIGAFSKIGSGGMGKPEMLAKNIGEALVCTASGLMIAITAMGFYFFFRNTLNSVVKESEAYFTSILDSMMGVGQEFEELARNTPAEKTT